jgi:multisubunit Na+/H+ antiporter MnhB subunit
MTGALAVDAVLGLSVLGLALWVLRAPSGYSTVLGFVAYGFLLTLVWVRLAAVDVALTEAALGSGLTGLLLLGAAARLAPYERAEAALAPGPGFKVLIALFCTALGLGLAALMLLLPEPAPTLAPRVAEHLRATGVQNPVTGVLLGFRAIDTLLETVVLLPAMVGVWSLASDPAWGGRPGSLTPVKTDEALTLMSRVLPPLGIVVGIHLLWVGADAPGGKFQGAAVLAALWALVLIAGLRPPPAIASGPLRLGLILGPLVFVAIGATGLWLAGAFLAYPQGWAKPLIVAIEVALLPSIALILGLLLAGYPARSGS